jgi:pimeloyl-ACP methyl ester carboxylesterase
MHQTLPTAPTDRTVPGDGVRLHARDWGVAAGALTIPALVLLHGLASNARIWDGVAAALLGPQSTGGPTPGSAPRPGAVAGAPRSSPPDPPTGLRMVALDLRGHGESEQPDGGYDFPTVARDVEIAMEALGIRRPVLAGHSWGANVALQVASSGSGAVEPAGLALIDGAFQSISEWPGMSRQAVRQRLAPPRFAVPLEDWRDQAGRWPPPASTRPEAGCASSCAPAWRSTATASPAPASTSTTTCG